MKRHTPCVLAAFACAGLLFSARGARAVDGVNEINDASIIAAGGYPYVIGASGSYVLTGSLTPPGGVDALGVAAPDVSIDLNGFQIQGFGLAADGIDAAGSAGLSVRNGTITGFTGFGIVAGPGARISRVRSASNGTGISAGTNCLILESTVEANGAGIEASRCKIENTVIVFNTGIGLFGGRNVIVHNQVSDNLGGGIVAMDGSAVQENVVGTNGAFGISDLVFGPPPPPPPPPLPARVSIRGNVVDGNGAPAGGAGISYVSTPALISDNTVSGNAGSGVVCGSACTLRGNLIDSNNILALPGSGGAVVGDGSNVSDNSISFNTGFGLSLPIMSGYSQNTLNANGADMLAIPPGPHPTSGFMNLCSGIPGPAPTCP